MESKENLTVMMSFVKSLTFIIGAVFLVSCASQSLISSWSNASLPGIKIDDVLIIGISDHATTRRIFEDSFVEDFQAAGIRAYPSYTIEEKEIAPTKEALLEVIKKTEAKTVLITHLVGSKEKTLYQQSVGRDFTPYHEPLHTAFFEANEAVTPVIKTTLYLETNIYDVKSEQLIWTAATKSVDPVMTKKYMRKTTDILMNNLKKEGLL